MKRIIPILFLAVAAFAQVNVQKTSGTNAITGNLVVGEGKSLVSTGTGNIVANTIVNQAAVATSGSASDLTTGTLAYARMANSPRRAASTVISDSAYNCFPGVCKTAAGNLYVVYRTATNHGTSVGVIVRRTSTDSGLTWSSAATILSDVTYDLRDPCITKLADDSLIISFFKYNSGTTTPVGVYTSRSTDSGATWGTPVAVGDYSTWGAVSAPVIQLGNGNLLLSTYGYDGATLKTKVHRSTNSGAAWTYLADIAATGLGYTEPNILLLSGGNILATFHNGSTMYTATSTDSGATWGSATAQFTLVSSPPRSAQYASGSIVVAYRTPVRTNYGQLAIRKSVDSGATWQNEVVTSMSTHPFDEEASWVVIDGRTMGLAFAAQASDTVAAVYYRMIAEEDVDAPLPTLNANGLYSANGDITITRGNIIFEDDIDGRGFIGHTGTSTGKDIITIQAGAGSGAWGGGINFYAANHTATGIPPGSVIIGLGSASTDRYFAINDSGLGGGNNVLVVDYLGRVSVGDWRSRVTARVQTLTDAASVTPASDSYDGGILTSLSQTTQIENPTGTPTDFQKYTLRIKSSSTRSLTWGTQFRGSTDLAIPSATTGSSKTDYLVFQWDAADSKWDLLSKTFGF